MSDKIEGDEKLNYVSGEQSQWEEDEFSYSGYTEQTELALRKGESNVHIQDEEFSYSGYAPQDEGERAESAHYAGVKEEMAIADAVSYGDFLIEEYSVEAGVKKVKKYTRLSENAVNYVFSAIYLIVGVLCVSITQYMLTALPYIVGSLMALMGLIQFIFAIKNKEYVQVQSNKTAGSLILIALAVMILVENEWAGTFIPIVWGIIGLVEGAHAFNHAFSRIARGMRCSYYLVKGVIEVVLAFLLLYEPAHHISLHIIVFGVELILDGITMFPPLKKVISKG